MSGQHTAFSGKNYAFISAKKNGWRYILGDSFKNSSGRPGDSLPKA
jgi:hypothetical protein